MDAQTILNVVPALFLTIGLTAFITHVVTASRLTDSFRDWLDNKFTDSEQLELRDAGIAYKQSLIAFLFHCPRCFSAWASFVTVPTVFGAAGFFVWSVSGVVLLVTAWGTVTYTVGAIESRL